MNAIKRFFSKMSAMEIAKREYEDCARGLLVAQATTQYGTAMTQYHTNRLYQLKKFMAGDA